MSDQELEKVFSTIQNAEEELSKINQAFEQPQKPVEKQTREQLLKKISTLYETVIDEDSGKKATRQTQAGKGISLTQAIKYSAAAYRTMQQKDPHALKDVSNTMTYILARMLKSPHKWEPQHVSQFITTIESTLQHDKERSERFVALNTAMGLDPTEIVYRPNYTPNTRPKPPLKEYEEPPVLKKVQTGFVKKQDMPRVLAQLQLSKQYKPPQEIGIWTKYSADDKQIEVSQIYLKQVSALTLNHQTGKYQGYDANNDFVEIDMKTVQNLQGSFNIQEKMEIEQIKK